VVLANPGTVVHSDPQLQKLHDRLNEVNRKLMAGELDIPPEHERSPSPEPIYDANGVRLNTREIRCAKGSGGFGGGERGLCRVLMGGVDAD
jgi:hypothetical protein